MWLVRVLLLERRNGEVVDWFMFFCPAGDLDLVAPFVGANIDCSFLDVEDPEGEGTIKECVKRYSNCCVEFGVVESKFEVPVEGRSANCKGSVAQRKTYICKSVGLLELKRVEIGGNCVV